jgi:hypothetical protein
LLLGLFASWIGLAVPAEARTHEVECGSGGAALQLAIDRARDGDTLQVRGICREAVRIVNRKLTLVGTPGATLEAPDYPWTALPHSTLHPILQAVGSKVRIEGLTVDGRSRADDPWASGLTGIHLLNSRGSLIRNRIVRIRHSEHRSDWEVSAIRIHLRPGAGVDGVIRVEENLIEDFESNAIFVQNTTSGGAEQTLPLTVMNNRIRGAGSMIQNQNGIQIGGLQDGGTSPIRARIKNNSFEGLFSYSGIWSSAALFVTPLTLPDRIVLRPYSIDCDGNVVDHTNVAFSLSTTSTARITGNTLQGGDLGIWAHASKLKLRGNRLSNLETGVLAVDSDLSPEQLHHRFTSRVRQNLVRMSANTLDTLPGRGANGKMP